MNGRIINPSPVAYADSDHPPIYNRATEWALWRPEICCALNAEDSSRKTVEYTPVWINLAKGDNARGRLFWNGSEYLTVPPIVEETGIGAYVQSTGVEGGWQPRDRSDLAVTNLNAHTILAVVRPTGTSRRVVIGSTLGAATTSATLTPSLAFNVDFDGASPPNILYNQRPVTLNGARNVHMRDITAVDRRDELCAVIYAADTVNGARFRVNGVQTLSDTSTDAKKPLTDGRFQIGRMQTAQGFCARNDLLWLWVLDGVSLADPSEANYLAKVEAYMLALAGLS